MKLEMLKNNSYQRQLGRLISYAKAMGITVFFRDWQPGDDAAHCTLDGQEITIFVKKRQSKIQTILTLLHECGHAQNFIHNKNREYDHKLADALEKTDKKSRWIVYQAELAGMAYWHTIYKECDLTFPIRKLEMEMEYDEYWYKIYWETGKGPTQKELKEYRRQLRKKYNYKSKK